MMSFRFCQFSDFVGPRQGLAEIFESVSALQPFDTLALYYRPPRDLRDKFRNLVLGHCGFTFTACHAFHLYQLCHCYLQSALAETQKEKAGSFDPAFDKQKGF
jgi:hypothetical protein